MGLTVDICCIKGCDKDVEHLGLCINHWRRNRLYGSPLALKSHSGQFRGMPAPERFARQFRRTDSGCWNWIAAGDKDGYGSFRGVVGGIPFLKAHRYSYALHNGLFDLSLMVCHKCDNPKCVNPEHLYLGTGKENQQDKWRKGRGRVPFGEKAKNALLTEAQAKAILSDPRTYSEIASEYNIAASTVGSLKQRISWKHLTIKEN